MWKLLVILSMFAVAQSCRVIEQKANGVQQERNVHPSFVLLETFLNFEQKYYCSGVLISADFVLTSAHCVFGALFVNVHVYAYNVRDVFESEREIYRSSNIVMKPEFDGFNNINDVALVRLPSTLRVSERPYAIAQLPNSPLVTGTEGKTVGWGLLDFKDDNAATYKHEQTMSVVSDEMCRQAYPGKWNDEVSSQGRVCIQRTAGTNCVSDSGSPFMIGDVVHGIQSFGQQEACDDALPNGIQSVNHHLVWINEVVQAPQVLSLKV